MVFARVFLPFALGYLLSYLLRTVNSVIAPALIADLDLSAADLGLITSANLFAFALFQIPLGILLDRYGPRKTEVSLLLIAAVGTAVFATAESLTLLVAGRAMIGLGTSACLMAAFTAYALWLPKERLPAINAYQMVAGGIGALFGTTPVEMLSELVGWRGVFWVLTAALLCTAAILFTVVPRRNEPRTITLSWGEAFAGVRHVFASPNFWRIAPLCVASQGAFIGIQSLWLGPWFGDVMGLTQRAAANALFVVSAAMIASYLTLAWSSSWTIKRGISTIGLSVAGMASFLCVQIVVIAEIIEPTIGLWMVWAFLGTFGILTYAGLTQQFPVALAGRVVTGINVLAFFAAFLVQWGIGVIIDHWPSEVTDGFAPEGYRWAFLFVAAVQVIALVWYFVFKPPAVDDSPS